jgi:hypothetical protein
MSKKYHELRDKRKAANCAPIILPTLTQVQNPTTATPRFEELNQVATTELKAGKQML